MNRALVEFRFPNAPDLLWPGDCEAGVAPYVLTEDIITAIKVGIVTRRPLLIAGPPGSGKTALAGAVAHAQGWSFLKYTLTSRSRLEDLTADIDQLQRLHDAQAAAAPSSSIELLPEWAYLKPGLFWWAFDSASALRKGRAPATLNGMTGFRPPVTPHSLRDGSKGVVVLLDEIDKAEPEIPNDLLEPLDRRCFSLSDGTEIKAPDDLTVLFMITTNGERELPMPFLRRCLFLELQKPDVAALVRIAGFHFKSAPHAEACTIFSAVASQCDRLTHEAEERGSRPPGTSEYLDAVRACLELGVTPGSPIWQQIERATLRKQPVQVG